jgi:ABC-type multidrug transport system fused ATPase/permease subunit
MDSQTATRVSEEIVNAQKACRLEFLRNDNIEKGRESKKALSNWFVKNFFAYPRALVKDSITLFDLPPLEPVFTIDNIDKEIHFLTENILKNKHQYNKVFKDVHSVYGLFDYIIKRIVRRERLKYLSLNLASGLLRVLFFYLTITAWRMMSWKRNGELIMDTTGYVYWPIASAAAVVVHVIAVKNLNYEDRQRLLAKQVLWQLVQEKISVSDMSFLEKADNNLLYKLLYLEFDDYVRPVPFLGTLLDICPIMIYLIYRTIFHETALSLISLSIFTARIALTILLGYIRRRFHKKYNFLTYEMRKSIYEFIKNYKSFTLKNLKGRYKIIAQELSSHKRSILRRLRRTTALESLVGVMALCCLICLPLLGVPFQMPCIGEMMPYLLLFKTLDTVLNIFASNLMEMFYYQSSRKVFNKFFDNDLVVDTVKQQMDSLPKGTIIIESCEVLERDQKNIIEALDYIRYKEEDSKYNPVVRLLENKKIQILRRQVAAAKQDRVLEPTKGRNEVIHIKHADTIKTQTSMRMRAYQRGETLKFNKNLISRLKVMISDLSLKIPAGSKLCIYENSNKTCINSFIKLLLGECFLNKGQVYTNGDMAYYNMESTNFLVGNTIRDNIIYGQPYKPDRYEKLLTLLGMQFGNYKGYDFYEMAEEGCNVKQTDRRLILLARFLYQDVDIYLIDVGFYELCQSINHGVIKYLFQSFFLNKTIVFVSDRPDMMSFSQNIAIFSRDDILKVQSTKVFLNNVWKYRKISMNRTNMSPTFLETRTQVLNTKLKNSVFICNVSFEEELRIHKDKEQRKAEIERMRINNTSVFQILSYGIYLTNKRRQEGKNLEDDESFNATTLLQELKTRLSDCINLKMISFGVMIHLLPMGALLTLESYVFTIYNVSYEGEPQVTKIRPRYDMVIISVVSILLYVFRIILIDSFLDRRTNDINQKQLNTVLNAGIGNILRMRSYRVLDKINREAIEVEVNLSRIIHSTLEQVSEFICFCVVLSYLYSIAVPLVILALFVSSIYINLRLFWPYYAKLLALLNKAEYKLDDFNFQLLELVASCRPAGMLEQIVKKRTTLADNYAKIKSAILFQFRHKIRWIVTVIHIFWLFVFVIVIYTYQKWVGLNLLKVKPSLLTWGLIACLRMTLSSWYLHVSFFENEQTILSFYRMSVFLSKAESHQNSGQLDYSSYKTRALSNLAYTVVFKNVSLTVGYQPVLKKVSFKIGRGEKVAVVGVEGGGRAALFDLIAGVVKRDNPAESDIIVLGTVVEDLGHCIATGDDGYTKGNNQSYKDSRNKREVKNIYYIERNPILIEGTIRENIDPNFEVDDDFIVKMLIKLNFEKVVSRDQIECRKDIRGDPRFFVDKKKSIFDLSLQTNGDLRKISLITHQFVPEGQIEGNAPTVTNKPNSYPNLDYKDLELQAAKKVAQTQIYTKFEHEMDLKYSKLEAYSESNIRSAANNSKPHQNESQDPPTITDKNLTTGRPILGQPNTNTMVHLEPMNNHEADDSIESVKTVKKSDKHKAHIKNPSIIHIKESRQIEKQKQHTAAEHGPKVHTIVITQPEGKARLDSMQSQGIDQHANNKPLDQNDSYTGFMKDGEIVIIEMDHNNFNDDEQGEAKRNDHSLKSAFRDRIHSKVSIMNCESIENEDEDYDEADFLSNIQKKLEHRAKRSSLLWARERNAQEEAPLFLKKKTVFEGKNFDCDTKRLVVFCRALITRPKLLLIFEEALDFGLGVAENLKIFSEVVPEASVICVTKTSANLLSFNTVLFMDAGKIIEKGKPEYLVKSEQTFLHKYLKEADREGFESLMFDIEHSAGRQSRTFILEEASPNYKTFVLKAEPTQQQSPIDESHPTLNIKTPISEIRKLSSPEIPNHVPIQSATVIKDLETKVPIKSENSNQALKRISSLEQNSSMLNEFKDGDRQGCPIDCRLLSTSRNSLHPDFSTSNLLNEKASASSITNFMIKPNKFLPKSADV